MFKNIKEGPFGRLLKLDKWRNKEKKNRRKIEKIGTKAAKDTYIHKILDIKKNEKSKEKMEKITRKDIKKSNFF